MIYACMYVYLFSNLKWSCPAGSPYLIMKVVLPYFNVYFLFQIKNIKKFYLAGNRTIHKCKCQSLWQDVRHLDLSLDI